MELRHLRYFVAVAEDENVSRAALRLHVSQPALSRQIHDLEDEIGFALFARSAKSVRLTEAGRVFLAEARAVIQRSEEAVKNARAVALGTRGEIHVGYAPSLTIEILPRALRAFQSRFPEVRVALHDLSTEEMLDQLLAGRLHAALMVRPAQRRLRELRFEELDRYPMCIAVAPKHPLARLQTASLAQAAREPLIAYSRKEYPEYHESLERMFRRMVRKPRITEEHDSVSSLIAAVEAGCGFALVPSCLACMVGARLHLLRLTPAPQPIVVGAAWLKKSVSDVVSGFIAAASMRGEPAAAP